ncbi:hypothetical protein WMY93_012351 [Mugilogobius chulae]|uniref:EGF-like domain-containing protein n=1 Tax=Mugilogobius chulae TaxID=88201 RepID=A0AAW0P6E8_9GOBI
MMMAKILWDTILLISGSLFTFGAGQNNSTLNDANFSFESNSTALPYFSTNSSSPSSPTNQTTTTATSTIDTSPIKKFVAAAVRSHFDDCPDSHRHFCFHGTCRFLILEETPACVCHQGFVGIRCEHADLLAYSAGYSSTLLVETFVSSEKICTSLRLREEQWSVILAVRKCGLRQPCKDALVVLELAAPYVQLFLCNGPTKLPAFK